MRRLLLSFLPLVAFTACDSNSPAPQPEARSKASAEPGPVAEAKAPAEPESSAQAKAPAKQPKKNGKRGGPPTGMEVLAQGSPTPTMTDVPSTAGPWTRGDKPTIVAFYRGHW